MLICVRKLDPLKNWFPIYTYLPKFPASCGWGFLKRRTKRVVGSRGLEKAWGLGSVLGLRAQVFLSITYVLLQKKMIHSKAGMGLEQVHVSCSTKPNVISLYNLSYVCAFNKPTLQKINRFVLLKLAHKGLEEKNIFNSSGGLEGNVTLQLHVGTHDHNWTGNKRIPSQALGGDLTLNLDGVRPESFPPSRG